MVYPNQGNTMSQYSFDIDKLKKSIEQSICFASTAKKMDCSTSTAWRWCKEAKLDTSHFSGRGGDRRSINSDEALTKGRAWNATIKRIIFRENLLPEICSECGLGTKWNGKSITLQLDHIDGDNSNNEISNLRILCPNCHTQTTTYCRNKESP